MATDDIPPSAAAPPPALETAAPARESGKRRVSLERPANGDVPPHDEDGRISRVPQRGIDARISVLEDRMPRLEATMQAGFEDLKTTCFLPMIARQEQTQAQVADIKREVDGVLGREKSIRWWAGKLFEKTSQVLSIAVFGWLWWHDSGLAGKISAWWFKIFF